MILLDLFCGAGGCSVGYSRAGFDVVGVDMHSQENYPFGFMQMDALDALRKLIAGEGLEFSDGRIIDLADISVIAASPPCQKYSVVAGLASDTKTAVDLVAPVRELLIETGKTYVIENVPGAPFVGAPLLLCGTMFDLRVRRHRYFENNAGLWLPPQTCNHWSKINENGFCTMFGKGASKEKGGNKAAWQAASGIDWMIVPEMSQAIPPAYTEYIGGKLIEMVKCETA